MKIINFLCLIAFGVLLIYASLGLPNRGDANAALNQALSPAGTPNASTYYIQNAYKDAHTPNVVSMILADYRSYDTLGEEVVIFTAGMVCYLLLRRKKNEED